MAFSQAVKQTVPPLFMGLVLSLAAPLPLIPQGFIPTAIAQAETNPKPIKVSLRGVEGITIGMTIPEAQKASGLRLVGDKNPECTYYKIASMPGLALMATKGRIARIDITNTTAITTTSGAKIGDTESRIKTLYPGQIRVQPHKYTSKGHYLVFVPKDAADKDYRLIFETDGKVVTRWRVGKLPEVEWVEGCS